MASVTVSTHVDRPRADVFGYLDDLTLHEAFTRDGRRAGDGG